MTLSILIMAGCGQGQVLDSAEPRAEPLLQETGPVEIATETPVEEMVPSPVTVEPTTSTSSTSEGITLTVPTPTKQLITREVPMPEIIGRPVEPEQAAALPQIKTAINDLAGRLGIPVDSISIVVVKEVTWGDASMGCPQPGMAYIQVPQDGLFIRLEANGQTYDYHSGGNREPFLCQQMAQVQKGTPFPQIDIVPPGSSIDE